MKETFRGGRIIIRATSFDACQSETMAIMDDLENGYASFTIPVKGADGEWFATGRIVHIKPEVPSEGI